jgi:hypothetical protein
MSNFIAELMENVGPEVSQHLASTLGISKNAAAEMIPQVAPLIMGGLKKQMETRGGADRANHILDKYGNASALDNIGETLSFQSRSENPDPRLGGLLGESGVDAANSLGDRFKLDRNVAMKIIPMLAPIILGALSKKRDQEGVGAGGIAGLIDRDGDGQILDDVVGFFTGSMGGGGSQKGSGLLGDLLGGFLGKK